LLAGKDLAKEKLLREHSRTRTNSQPKTNIAAGKAQSSGRDIQGKAARFWANCCAGNSRCAGACKQQKTEI
jgi:hypothetical protein